MADRKHTLRWKFNISEDEWTALLARQGGGCAICGSADPGGAGGFHVDHDHACCQGKRSCGKCIRGLLCARCNMGLGFFADDDTRLARAVAYLRGGTVSPSS